MYSKTRIEALSDAIFAIAMTLLVLDLKVPTSFPPGHVWQALKPQGEQWLSFVLTFGLTARFWTLQHDAFQLVHSVGRNALKLTFLFLGLVSVLPYTTSLLGAHFSDPSVFTLYVLHELAIAGALIAKLEVCSFHGHTHRHLSLWPLRFRLYGISATLLVCLIYVWILPLRWIFIPVVLIGILERWLGRHFHIFDNEPALPE